MALQEIVVTGSRISTVDGFGSVSPVSVVGMEDIKTTGFTRLEDVLNSMPSVETAQTSFISNGSTGTASIDLRGMGSNRTLVLFNGKRLQPGGVYTTVPDINQIPSAIIDRVEVLTGGASATYGADAVAGVVNFITRRVNGIEMSVGVSGYQHDNSNGYIQRLMDARGFTYPTGDSGFGGETYNFDVVMGTDFKDGRGNATVYATYRKGEALLQGERDYSSCALSDPGTSCGGSGTAPIPNFFIAPTVPVGDPDNDGAPISPYTGLQYDWTTEGFYTLLSTGGLGAFSTNRYNYAPVNYFMRPEQRYSLGAFVDYEINDHFTPYLEANFNSSSTAAQIAESGTFFAETYFFPVNSPLFPTAFRNSLATLYPGANEVGVYIGKRNVEGGPRSDVLDHDSFRIVLGTKGQLVGNWDYDLFYQYGGTSSSTTYINDLFLPNIAAAVGPDCATSPGGCYQVFTYQGVTPAMAAALGGTAIARGETSNEITGGYVSGDFGVGVPNADPIQMVFGYEHRTDRFDRVSDTIYQEGSLAGQGGPTPNLYGVINVTEFFTEFSVPLLQDVQFARALTLDLAYRYSDYNTSGTTDTYRYGLDWQPVDMFRVRTGFNRAVRAANAGELFDQVNIGLWSGSDPCAGATPTYTAAECARTGVTASQYGNISASPASQYNQLTGGNPNLQPEKADTVTFGVVVDPIDNLTFSIDYWKIDVEETIATLGAALILEQCGKFNQLCSAVRRAGNGSLWQGQAGYVENTRQNFGEVSFEGIDVAARYSLDALDGRFIFNLAGTKMLTKEYAPIPTQAAATYDCVGVISEKCYPSPSWRHNLSVTYDSNEFWTVGAKWRYYSGLDYEGSTDTIVQANVGSQSYFDLNASFSFFENSDVVIGISNVLDEEPPMMGGTLSDNANTIAGFWDTLGRYAFLKATFRF